MSCRHRYAPHRGIPYRLVWLVHHTERQPVTKLGGQVCNSTVYQEKCNKSKQDIKSTRGLLNFDKETLQPKTSPTLFNRGMQVNLVPGKNLFGLQHPVLPELVKASPEARPSPCRGRRPQYLSSTFNLWFNQLRYLLQN